MGESGRGGATHAAAGDLAAAVLRALAASAAGGAAANSPPLCSESSAPLEDGSCGPGTSSQHRVPGGGSGQAASDAGSTNLSSLSLQEACLAECALIQAGLFAT